MSRTKKTDGVTAFSKVLSYVLIVLLVAAVAAGAVALFANGGSAFYVEYDGKRYGVSEEKISLPQQSEYVFTVGSMLGDSLDYFINVRANSESALAFSVNGSPYKFYTGIDEYDDYTGYFGITAVKGKVMFSVPSETDMLQVLQYQYDTEDIAITQTDETDEFEIVFSSEKGQVVFTFGLYAEVTDLPDVPEEPDNPPDDSDIEITLDPPSIVF